MSHTATVFAPAGTPLPDRTVGEIVAENPSQARVFQAFGIDFCCQGGRTLREACILKGIGLESVIEQLEAAAVKATPESNPALLPAVELIAHIVDKHHGYLRSEPEEDLHRHIHLENAVLFPQAMKLAGGAG